MSMRKLFALAQANGDKAGSVRAEAAGDTATVYIYGVIDSYWGVSAAAVAAVLSGITAPNLVVRINTPGGDVFEARAIMTLLVEHPATVTAKIDGLAASAGSVIALAAERVEIAEGGFYMIHQGWTFMMGNADDLRATAAILDKVDASLIADYVAKSGASAEQVKAWMAAETWFDANEAVEAGFCDGVLATTAAKAKAQGFDLAVYDKAPKALTEHQPDDGARARALARLGFIERTAA